MQPKPTFPRKQIFGLSILLFLCLLVVLFDSCRKNYDAQANIFTTGQVNNFFKLPAGTTPETRIVVAEMQKQLKAQDVNNFLNWHGQPIWDKAVKLDSKKENSITYLIPIAKEKQITAFFGATVMPTGKILFEMHRQSTQVDKAKEYSYANIGLKRSSFFLNYFNGVPTQPKEVEAISSTGENNFAVMVCWWESNQVECNYFNPTDSTAGIIAPPCFEWREICIPIGSDDTPGGGGGGGGGGCTTCPPPCPTDDPWFSLVPPEGPPGPCEPNTPPCAPDQMYNSACLSPTNYPGKEYTYPYLWWNDTIWINAHINSFAANTNAPSLRNPIIYNFVAGNPSINLQKYINCFNAIPNAGATCTIKICADLPHNTEPDELVNDNMEPGHAFLIMTKTNGNQTVTQTFGFYPAIGKKSIFSSPVTSTIVDDGKQGFEHEYNASMIMNISVSNFNLTLSLATTAASLKYDLDGFNCADFALTCFNFNRNVPIAVPDWQIINKNYGTTPNGLYKKLQEMKAANGPEASSIQIGTFNAPKSHGECP